MATRETNLALTERGYELFAEGDLEGMRGLFDENVVWRTTVSMFASEYKGVDEVLGYFGKLFEMSGGTLKNEPMYMLADDHRVIAMEHVTGTHEDKLLDIHLVRVFEIADEKAYEVTEFVSEPAKLEAFWA